MQSVDYTLVKEKLLQFWRYKNFKAPQKPLIFIFRKT